MFPIVCLMQDTQTKPHGQNFLILIRWYSACLPNDDQPENQNAVLRTAALKTFSDFDCDSDSESELKLHLRLNFEKKLLQS